MLNLSSRIFRDLNRNARLIFLRTLWKPNLNRKARGEHYFDYIFGILIQKFLNKDFSRTLVVTPIDFKNDNYSKNSNRSIYAISFFFLSTIFAKDNDQDDADIIFSSDQNHSSVNKKEISNRERFNFIADTVEKVLPSIVQIEVKQNLLFGQGISSGSGFIVSSDGIILTNAHVVSSNKIDIMVKLNNGKSFRGRVLKLDQSSDIAVIKIDCVNLNNLTSFGT